MKFSILKDAASRGINIVNKAVNPKAAIPALSNVLIKAVDNQVKLTTSDLQVTISVWLGAKIDQPGEITVPAKLLQSFVTQVADDQIDFTLKEDKLNLKTKKANSNFSTIPASEFPDIEVIEEGSKITLKSSELAKVMQHIQFIPAANESRPVLTGIYIKISGGEVVFAVTDGFRMGEYRVNLETPAGFEEKCIVPAKSFSDIAKSFCADSENIEITINNSRNIISLKADNMQAQMRMIEGEFPPYKDIIPTEFETKVSMTKTELGNAIKLASIFSKDHDNMVKVIAKSDGVTVLSQPTESGSNSSSIEGAFTGNDVEIAFNAKYILDFVSNIPSEEVSFEANDTFKPAALKVKGTDNYVYIVMPMRSNW